MPAIVLEYINGNLQEYIGNQLFDLFQLNDRDFERELSRRITENFNLDQYSLFVKVEVNKDPRVSVAVTLGRVINSATILIEPERV